MKSNLANLFRQLLDVASQKEVEPYVVGGFVRDLLLQNCTIDNFDNSKDPDVDLVLEVETDDFSIGLQDRFSGKLLSYPNFLSKKLLIEDQQKWGISEIDILRARTEKYTNPGSLPVVVAGSLVNDLSRRDFTINALACKLTDFVSSKTTEDVRLNLIFEGSSLDDLKNKVLRIFHEDSFVDDPTRLYRVVRYAGRLNFEFESATQKAFLSAIETGALETISAQRRSQELKKIFSEKHSKDIWLMVNQYDLFGEQEKQLLPDLKLIDLLEDLDSCNSLIGYSKVIACLLLLIYLAEDQKRNEILTFFNITKKEKRLLLQELASMEAQRFDVMSDTTLLAASAVYRDTREHTRIQSILAGRAD